ncbi:uncharacterized protein [Nicotiana tomentosiformis]|uniref:uncharacterized protein n=1 Tax=Nicotiana tomentosiformis TaxID=4098 RepID=UPI00388C5E49
MSNSQSAHLNIDTESSHHGENNNLVPNNDVLPVDPNGVPAADPIDANSQAREAPEGEGDGVSLRLIFKMLQAQQAATTQLQNQSHAPNRVEPEQSRESTRKDEQIIERPTEAEPGVNLEVMKILEALTKQVESGEKKIKANDKKVETYNSRVDQILGAPPILKGPDSKIFIQKPFPPREAPKPIPKRFRMPDLPKYNGTTYPNEHVTSYTCTIKGNILKDDEIESVLLKTFGETLSKGEMIWYRNLPPKSIDSFVILADAFIKAHVDAIKFEIRKSDLFKVKQRNNEMLREFVSRFQMEQIELQPVADDWAVQAFILGLNP